jgi:error-prone DNA polymerase
MASLLKKYGWHEWLCHTNFSFLVGASHPCEYLERATKFGYKSLAVTDYDGVYGLARTHLELKKMQNPVFDPISVGLKDSSEYSLEGGDVSDPAPPSKSPDTLAANFPKLIHGAEFHLCLDHDRPLVLQDTVALVARNQKGYANLCRLSSFAHRAGKSDAYVPLEELLRHNVEGLSLIQPMRGIMRAPLTKEGKQRFQDLKDHFNGDLAFAFSRHLNPSEDCWLENASRLAKQLGAKRLLSQDAYFHAAQEKDMSDLLQAIRTNKTMEQSVHHMFVNSERCFHSLEGIEARMRGIPFYEEGIINGRELADSCDFSMDALRYQYPKEMIPEGYGSQGWLEHLVWKNAKERYGSPVPGKIRMQLSKELNLIEKLKFADYFLTVWDIVRWARDQGILCQGRGSAANSAVCFVLGVTSVDPSLFDLVFERFISVERGDPPDIDVDFEHERREEVIQYIYKRYGRGKAAMVANVITFRSKGALRSVGKALGMPEPLMGAASKLMATKFHRRSDSEEVLNNLKDTQLPGQEQFEEDLSKEPADTVDPLLEKEALALYGESVPWELWAEMAERLRGFPRHLGIHSGGFMLADKPLDELVAQEPATMENRTVVQWCKDDIEGLGFFKIDVLALGMLTAIRKSFTYIKESYGKEFTMDTVPHEDPSTYAMIQRADTVGTFQIESRAQMSMLPRLRPRTFYDLVIEVAIIRPGPIQGGMIHPYLRRRNGQEAVTFPNERLRPILARTLGIPIFQEQVMRIAMAVGDFTAGEANELRRKMGAWTLKGDLGPMLEKLARGMRKNDIGEEFIKNIISQMKGFADYGFPESHAVSFALIAYVSCFLKCHFPAAFFSSVLNSQPMGFYSPHALLQSAQRDGVTVLPICINKSEWDCTLEEIEVENQSVDRPKVFGIRLGFNMVNSFSKKSGEILLEKREQIGGEWGDIEHFLQSVSIFRNDLTALAAANAFKAFGLKRKAALWLAEAAPFCPVMEDEEEEFSWEKENSMERIVQDFASTNTTLGSHPVTVVRKEYWCYAVPEKRIVRSKDISKIRANKRIDIFGMVLVRQAPPSAKGMVFLTLEDESGFINLAFTPEVYSRFYQAVEGQAFLCIRGKVQKNNESHSLLVENVYESQIDRAEVISMSANDKEELALRRTGNKTANMIQGSLPFGELQKTRNFH